MSRLINEKGRIFIDIFLFVRFFGKRCSSPIRTEYVIQMYLVDGRDQKSKPERERKMEKKNNELSQSSICAS